VQHACPDFFARSGFASDKNRTLNLCGTFRMVGDSADSGVAADQQAGGIIRRELLKRTQRIQYHGCHLFCSAAILRELPPFWVGELLRQVR
jgi:hypothetical protein